MDKLTDEQLALLSRLADLPDEDIDTSEMPELPPEAWDMSVRGKIPRRRNEAVTIRLDTDVLSWFRTQADNGEYEAAINSVLRQHVKSHQG